MDIKKIKSFLAIMKYHNLTDASEACYVSESSISKHIVSLEHEFGVKFFNRRTHGYYPTKAAFIFNDYANTYIDNYQHIVNRLHNYQCIQESMLTIASTSIMSEYKVTECGFKFAVQHPDIKLSVLEAEADDISHLLYEEKVNCAFVSRSVLNTQDFDILDICNDSFSVVLSVNHPFSKMNSISIDALKSERFIVTGTRSSQYHFFMDLCKRHGFSPNIVHTTERFDSLMDMIGYGFGISLLMNKLALKHINNQVKVIPLSQHVYDAIALIKLKNAEPNKSVQLLWDYMHSYVTSSSNDL